MRRHFLRNDIAAPILNNRAVFDAPIPATELDCVPVLAGRHHVVSAAVRMSFAGAAQVTTGSCRGNAIHHESAARQYGLSAKHTDDCWIAEFESRAGNAELR